MSNQLCPACGAPIAPGSQACGTCGRPLGASTAAPVQPVAVQPSPAQPMPQQTYTAPQQSYTAPAPAPAAKGGCGTPIAIGGCGCIALIGILLVALGVAAFLYKDQIKDWIEAQQPSGITMPTIPSSTDPSSTSPSATTPSTGATTPGELSAVKVILTWDQPVDMDLELWNSSGENLVERAFKLCGEDVKDGTAGNEWFEFISYPDHDFSTGNYMVSIYFADRPEGSSVDQVTATLTILKADGSTVTRTKTVHWEPGKDQWHAFKINARTGAITDVNRFIRVQQNNN